MGNILIIDDDINMCKSIRRLLLMDDHVVYEAHDGSEGLKILWDNPMDLVITDIMMPGMDGYEVCRRLKASEHTVNIPVIFVTAFSDEDYLQRVKTVEPLAYIVKPYQLQELNIVLRIAFYKIEAEKRQRILREKLQSLIDNTSDMIILLSASGEVNHVSHSCETFLGCPPAEFIGRKLMDFIDTGYKKKVSRFLKDLKQNYEAHPAIEFQLTFRDGEPVWVEARATHIINSELLGGYELVLTCSNINERKLTESLSLKTQQILTEQNRALSRREAALFKKLELTANADSTVAGQLVDRINSQVFPIIEHLKEAPAGISRPLLAQLERVLYNLARPLAANRLSALLKLTAQELRICSLIIAGHDSRYISESIGITIRTAQNHRMNIRKKLGIVNRNVNLKTYIKGLV